MANESSTTLKTVLGALEVLEYLGGRDGEPVRLTDISRDLHFPKPRVYRILSTLELGKYVWQDPDNRCYSLSLRTWLLGRHTNVFRFVNSVVEPCVDGLAKQSRETAIFAILDGLKTVHLYISHSPNPVLAYVREGSRVPLHASATGKAILSNLGTQFITKMLPLELERFTPHTITDRSALIQDIQKVHQRGFATGIEEISEGLSGVAAAAVIGKQMIHWAIGISGPSSRISNSRIEELGELAVKTVKEITKELET